MNFSKIIIILLFVYSTLFAQFSKSEFFERANKNYHSLESEGLNNFVCWATSNTFEEESESVFKKNILPWEIIWINPDRLIFSKGSLPSVEDTSKNRHLEQLQLELKRELQGIFLDWNRFIGRNLLATLPSDYSFTIIQDTVLIKYETKEISENIEVSLYYGFNSLCFKIELIYLNKDKKMYIYPNFRYVDDKWLCKDWTVQIIEKGEIKSGLYVKVESQKLKDYWLPKTFHLQIQTKEAPEKIFSKIYKFSNILLNKEIIIKK